MSSVNVENGWVGSFGTVQASWLLLVISWLPSKLWFNLHSVAFNGTWLADLRKEGPDSRC